MYFPQCFYNLKKEQFKRVLTLPFFRPFFARVNGFSPVSDTRVNAQKHPLFFFTGILKLKNRYTCKRFSNFKID